MNLTAFGTDRVRDEVILVARILLIVLFLVFGWGKLTDYSGTVAYMTQSGAPLPSVAALVAIVIEFFGGIALILGVWTRPLAVLLAFFTLAAGLIGHRYWTMTGADPLHEHDQLLQERQPHRRFLPVVRHGRRKILNRRKVRTARAPPRRDAGSLNAAG